jgi:hypothetical protein
MPTNKELLEAAAFERRRLVAALLRGATYDEAPGVLRAVFVGVVLAAIAVAASLAARYLGVG